MKSNDINIFKIRRKLSLMILIIVVFSIVGTKVYDYNVRVNSIEKSVREDELNAAILTASRLETEIQKTVSVLETAATNGDFAITDENKLMEMLASIKKQNNIFSVVFLADSSLNRINDKGEKASLADREYMQEVKKTKKTVISKEVLISNATNQPCIMIVTPIKVSGAPERYLGVSVGVDNFQNIIDKAKKSDSNYSFAFDGKNGLVFAHPIKEYVGTLKFINPDEKDKSKVPPELQKMAKASSDRQSGTEIYDFNDTKIIAGYTNIPGTYFGVATRMSYDEAMEPVRKEMLSALIIILITSLISIVAATIFARFIAKPIEMLVNQANIIASGDFTKAISIKVNRRDEIGQLEKAFKDMAIMLKTSMEKISGAASNIAASSKELEASTEQSAEGSTQVAETVSEVAAGNSKQVEFVDNTVEIVKDIGYKIDEITSNASQVVLFSKESTDAAISGGQTVQHAVDSIMNINSNVQDTAHVIRNLGNFADKISKIVDTISDISSQTNLLALNASIEAARAGEHGRGFSVVAEEVRKLAEESEKSASSITKIIEDIQKQTQNAIDKMDKSAKDVSTGQDIVLASGESFKVIEEKIGNVNKSIQQITETLKDLSVSSNSVITSVEEIRNISKETAANSETISAATEEQSASIEEVASSAESLAELANQLEEIIEIYKF